MSSSGGGPPSPEEQLMRGLMESCPAKVVMSSGAGFAVGGVFGLFMSSIDAGIPSEEFQKLSGRQQARAILKDMAGRSYSSAKNFGLVAAIFSGSECFIESYRAKNDIYNGLYAGCFTGATLAARAGPAAMAYGCAGFAAFSGAIDYWIRHSE